MRQKERKGRVLYLYSTLFAKKVHSKRSGMDHTVCDTKYEATASFENRKADDDRRCLMVDGLTVVQEGMAE